MTAAVALGIGLAAAAPYTRLAAPVYDVTATAVGGLHGWTVTGVAVEPDGTRPGLFLRLHGRLAAVDGSSRNAWFTTRVQVGAVIEDPLIYWALLLAWPAARRDRVARLAIGVPVFIGLETATTSCQLLAGFAQASVTLAGHPDAVTAWDRWSRFLESGGRDVLAVCAALLTVTLASRLTPGAAGRPR